MYWRSSWSVIIIWLTADIGCTWTRCSRTRPILQPQQIVSRFHNSSPEGRKFSLKALSDIGTIKKGRTRLTPEEYDVAHAAWIVTLLCPEGNVINADWPLERVPPHFAPTIVAPLTSKVAWNILGKSLAVITSDGKYLSVWRVVKALWRDIVVGSIRGSGGYTSTIQFCSVLPE